MQELINQHILEEIRELRRDIQVLHGEFSRVDVRFVELKTIFTEDVKRNKKRTHVWGGSAGGIVAALITFVWTLMKGKI